MSTEKIYQAVLKVARKTQSEHPLKTHLDIGAGTGRLIRLLHDELDLESSACDYTAELMELPGQGVDVIDLNDGRLPYSAGSYDIVTATEVIEHLKDYRGLLSDIYRVLTPGGTCILSTPNVLNLNSEHSQCPQSKLASPVSVVWIPGSLRPHRDRRQTAPIDRQTHLPGTLLLSGACPA
jgi:2-polyprenyl-3-methyl-5-hydroxy-6-metoxy-1,4-benzoquinol methylase